MHGYLNLLANIIISRYFQEFSCVVLIKDAHDDVVKMPENIARIIFNAGNQDSCEILKARCQGFIINSIQTLAILNDLEQKLVECSIGGFTERKYLILNYTKKIFALPIMKYIKDILIVRPRKERGRNFDLLTHKFVGNRGKTDLILLDVWLGASRRFIYNTNLYPRKTGNLKGRTITLSTFSYFPYSMVGKTFAQSKGIEMILMQEFLRKHNAKASLVAREDDEWGTTFDNGTGNGVIGDIMTRRCDIGFAALFMRPDIYPFAEFTTSTFQLRVKCLVPKSEVKYNWLSVWVYFPSELWVLLAVVLLLSSVVVSLEAIVKNYGRYRSGGKTWEKLWYECSLFRVCGVMVFQSVYVKSDKHKSAVFLLLNLFSMVIGALYGSGTTSRMAIPRKVGEINTVADMAENNLQWGSTQNLWLISILQEERKEYRKIMDNFIIRNKTELIKLGRTARFGFPVDQLPSGFIALQKYLDEAILERLRPMKYNIYTEYVVLYTRKNYVLFPALNDFLLKVRQSGLMGNWETRAATSKSLHLQYVVKYLKRNKNVLLKWKHIKGVFAIWFVGMAISVLVFGIELKAKNNRVFSCNTE